MTSISPTNILLGEVYGLISHLKSNSRWSSSSYGYQSTILPENPILKSLKNLTNTLHNATDFNHLDTCVFLDPFLAVIKSNETSGPITGAALTSVGKFLNMFINDESNNIHKAIKNIAESAAHCKFEATDARSDEVVLMKILQVLALCVKNDGGIYLHNELVYEITSTCYHMADQARSSELLKKSAESFIQEIVSVLYTRYSTQTLPPTPPPLPPVVNNNNITITTTTTTTTTTTSIEENTNGNGTAEVDFSPNNDLFFSNLPSNEETSSSTTSSSTTIETPTKGTSSPKVEIISTSPPTTKNSVLSPPPNKGGSSKSNTPTLSPTSSNRHNNNSSNSNNLKLSSQSSYMINPRGVRFDTNNQNEKPYDSTVLTKLFKFFTNNLSPSNDQEISTKLLNLNLINNIIQIRGVYLEEIPEIMEIIQQDLFKYLLLNLQLKVLPIYSLTIRIFFNLFISLKRTLKSQFEEFFNVLMNSISDNKAHYELQELALEGLRDFCKLPHTMVDLFINYDCEMHCSNLFENLCKFLYKNSFPISGPLTSFHILSLENLLSVMQSIDDRRFRAATAPSPTDYLAKKETKRQFIIAAEHFNRRPKDAIEYIMTNRLYPDITHETLATDPDLYYETIARFLLDTPKLNKLTVGEFLGKRDTLSTNVLDKYIRSFDLVNTEVIINFRHFLESFRIPGDSNVIALIFERFSQLIFELRPENFESPDKIYLFLYAALMLHTSIFNPSIKVSERLNYTKFKSMLHKELADEVIDITYKTITKEEMVVEEDIVPGLVDRSNWHNILKRAKRVGDYVSLNTNDYDRDIFSIVLNLVIPAISKVFEKVETESLCQRILDGFHLCAQVSANYNIHEVIDSLMSSLCNNTTLIDNDISPAPAPAANGLTSSTQSSSTPLVSTAQNTPPAPVTPQLSQSSSSSAQNHEFIFIGDNKAQLATIATFEIAIKYSHLLNDSWKYIIAIICKLNKLDLLPNIFELVDFSANSLVDNSKNNNLTNKKGDSSSTITTTSTTTSNSTTTTRSSTSSTFLRWLVSEEYEVYQDKDREKAKTCIENCHMADLFLETKSLPINSLEQLLNSLYYITNPLKNNNSANSSNTNNDTTASTTTTNLYYGLNIKQELFCFDLLTHIIVFNQQRLDAIWSGYYKNIESIINLFEQQQQPNNGNNNSNSSNKTMIPLVEKTILSLMYILIRLIDHPQVYNSLLSVAALLLRVGSVLDRIAEKVSISLYQLIQEKIEFISTTPDAWEPIISIIAVLSGNHKSANRSCDAFALMIKHPNSLTDKTSEYSLEPIKYFINSKGIPNSVVIKAMELLYYIFTRISTIMQLPTANTHTYVQQTDTSMPATINEKIQKRKMDDKIALSWKKFWLPILTTFSSLCLDSRADVRNNAMTLLQKSILSSSLGILPPQRWVDCFVDVVFPLLNDLKDSSRDFEDTRLRASALLSKVFLQNLSSIIKCDQFTTIWSEILSLLNIYMGLSELLSESVPESLKNMLLVMNNVGVFKPPHPSDPALVVELTEQELEFTTKLWDLTWTSIDSFCPKIRDDILSRVDPQPPTPPVTSPPIISNNNDNTAVAADQQEQQETPVSENNNNETIDLLSLKVNATSIADSQTSVIIDLPPPTNQ
ncbi:hypothetical protein CYY_001002 [Polysphondylium violaceum]|uniref:SEC7 domain-containing protein n=1 Tax=Polysphondylium violaceum TaxID=133409 RepID=A0A8J4UWM8_9MYCE|nr:hypothetical protein CYY_001002 [Polysphondylium violaceum]